MSMVSRQFESSMSRRSDRDKDVRRQSMEAVNWTPVGVVALLVTGIVALAALDAMTITVTTGAFTAGFATGRLYALRHPTSQPRDGGDGE